MLDFLLTLLITLSVAFSVYTGDTHKISSCIPDGIDNTISLCFTLAGSMALWGGIMNIMEKSGATQYVTHLMKKPVGILFSGLKNSRILGLISLNITANMLGLGNAAFPLALVIMKKLKEEDGCSGRATALFIILNTASVQLLPFTTAALRVRNGAEDPWDILPASLLTSAAALSAGVAASIVFFPGKEKRA